MSGFTQCMPFAALDHAFLAVLADASVKTCVIFLLAGLTSRLLCNSSAAMRHLVWSVAFLAFLLLPILSITAPKWQVLPGWLGTGSFRAGVEEIPGRSAHRLSSSNQPDAGPGDLSEQRKPASATLETDSTKPIAASSPELAATTAWSWNSLPPSRLVFVLWSTGFGLLLLRIGCSRCILHHVMLSADPVEDGSIDDEINGAHRQLGIRHKMNVRLSSRRRTPMTWGLLRTYLLLPADAPTWGQSRIRAVVLHELAHVKHCDTLTHTLAQLICAIYWFHPCVWLTARWLHVECERACDDLVLQSGVRASDYAEDLLGLLVRGAIPCTALAITGQSELEVRLRAILNERVNRKSITGGVLALALVVSVTATTALAMLQAPNGPAAKVPASQSARTEAAASQSRRQPAQPLTVLCVDADGKPIAGAEVHLYQREGEDDGRYVHSGPFTSDAEGRAVGARAIFSNGLGNLDRWIYARVPGRLVGVARSTKWTNRASSNPEPRVVLQTSRSIEGKVKVPPGFDLTKVVVRVHYLQVYHGPGVFELRVFSEA